MEQESSYIEDEMYVIKAQQGDADALAFLMKKYHNLAHYIALKICHCDADAEDIVQESFIEIERSIGNLKEPRYFKAWLNKIIFSKSTKLFRSNKDVAMSEKIASSLKQAKESRRYLLPEKEHKFRSDRDVLMAFINELPEKLRITLYLMYFEQLSVKEITMILDIPEGTVKSRISSAKLQLKEKIEEYEQREQVKLDFHAISFDALLASVLIEEFQAYSAAAVSISSTSLFTKLLKGVPPTTLAMITFGVVSTSSLAYAGYQAYKNHQQPPIEENQPIVKSVSKTYSFTPITFQGQTLTTAKDAHTAITSVAHCEEEILQLDKETQEEIKQVYLALKSNGGAYYELLYHRGYAQLFE